MDTENHPSPLQDAMQEALRHAVEVAYLLGTGAQIYLHRKRAHAQAAAERDHQARRALNAQIRADRDAARAGWAPALDPDWLRRADLLQAARAWGAAMPYADRAQPWYEPAAAASMRQCEQRLRDLHPHAMARYDRLRADGMSPADAMRETAPLFARPPRVHDAPSPPARPWTRETAPPPGRQASPARPRMNRARQPPARPSSGAADRSSGSCRRGPAQQAAPRSAQRSSAPSWRPSLTCRPLSSARSCSPAPARRPRPTPARLA